MTLLKSVGSVGFDALDILVQALAFGLAMTLIFGGHAFFALRKFEPAERREAMRPRAARSLIVNLDVGQAFVIAKEALEHLAGRITVASSETGELVADMARTGGGVVTLSLKRLNGDRTEVTARSRSKNPIAISDTGINLGNVKRVCARLAALATQHQASL